MAKGKRNSQKRKKSFKGTDDGENDNDDEGKYNEDTVEGHYIKDECAFVLKRGQNPNPVQTSLPIIIVSFLWFPFKRPHQRMMVLLKFRDANYNS